MPVMKQLRIGSATYDTVGEASVTQVQTSGTKIATVTLDGTSTDLYAPEGGGGGGGVGLVINVVVDSSGNVVSHDADTATCLEFAQAAVNNSDASAVAYVRNYSYDDEDDYYSSFVYRLPLTSARTSSYGGGQYEVDGGIRLTFSNAQVTITGSSKMSINAKVLDISTMNDDPEMPVDITYKNERASSNS